MRKVFVAAIVLGFLSAGAAQAEQVTYTKDIKSVMEKQCLACHGSDAAPEYVAFKKDQAFWMKQGKGPRMDTYSHLVFYTAWQDTGALMRRLDDGKASGSGKPGNMYQYLGADEPERQKNLSLFKQWVGGWTLKRLPDITKEEIAAIKVTY
ncbi:MAG TPA: hypothetical protein VLH56_08325 [Dissulfurispiraceae bacterium]|nr:hypothetical protein [Dissulfurispiraceae bacterium]